MSKPVQPGQGLAALEHAANDTYTALSNDPEHMDEDAVWLREQRDTNKGLHWLKRPSIVMLGLCVWLASSSHACGEGTRQSLTYKLACNTISDGSSACDPTESQLLVSKLQQYYSVCSGIITMFALGKVGPLSDQYGRKMFMLWWVVAIFAGKLTKFLVMLNSPTLHFKAMVFTEALQNVGGGIVCLVTLAQCYVSDIAETHQRTYYLGIQMAALFLGFSTGPLIGNALLALGKKSDEATNPAEAAKIITPGEFLPLKAELGFFAFLLLLILFLLPESRSDKARQKSRKLSRSESEDTLLRARGSKLLNSLNFLKPLRILCYPKDKLPASRHQSIRAYRTAVMALVFCECVLVSLVIPLGEIFILYGIWRFKWGAKDIGHLLAASSSSRAFTLIVLSPIIHHKFFEGLLKLRVHHKYLDDVDYGMISMAFLIEIIGMTALSMATSTPLFLMCSVFSAVAAIAGPALNSSIVKFYPELCIGEVFGGMALIKNTLGIVVPVCLLGLYKFTLKTWLFPQFVFLTVAGCFVLFYLSVSYAKWVLYKEQQFVELVGGTLTPSSSSLNLSGGDSGSESENGTRTPSAPLLNDDGTPRRPLSSHSRNASFSV